MQHTGITRRRIIAALYGLLCHGLFVTGIGMMIFQMYFGEPMDVLELASWLELNLRERELIGPGGSVDLSSRSFDFSWRCCRVANELIGKSDLCSMPWHGQASWCAGEPPCRCILSSLANFSAPAISRPYMAGAVFE